MVEYTTVSKKISIICPELHVFEQTVSNHRKGQGCPICSGKGGSLGSSKESFIFRAEKIHGNKYDYSLLNDSVKGNIKIICPNHGEFIQNKSDHLSGGGCSDCANDSRKKMFSNDLEYFISRSNMIHGNKYDYSKSIYVNNKTDVKIICPEHGEFLTLPTNHYIRGSNCPECAKLSQKENNKGFYNKTKAERGDFDFIGEIYLLQFEYQDKIFCKIGVTKDFKRRISHIPSELKLIDDIHYNLETLNKAIILEHTIKYELDFIKYIPKLKFNGMYECFEITEFDKIKSWLDINAI